MKTWKQLFPLLFLFLLLFACKKEKTNVSDNYTYYEVGFNGTNADWRDTAFVVRTNNIQLIHQLDSQLTLPIEERQLVVGTLAEGSGGYNRNAAYEFKWHFKENDWHLADATAEILDGKPYTDVDKNWPYWRDTIKYFGAWSSYIKKKFPPLD